MGKKENIMAKKTFKLRAELYSAASFKSEQTTNITERRLQVNNDSVYMVRFVEPPYGGSSKDVFLFASIQAIYSTFTKEQIGCGVNRLWNIGLAKGNAYRSKHCTITKEPFMRMKRKSAPTGGDNLTNDNLHDNKSNSLQPI